MSSIKENIDNVKKLLQQAAIKCKRDAHSIKLVAVSKKKSIDSIIEAIKCNQLCFGENYAQEFRDKCRDFSEKYHDIIKTNNIEWHFIGYLQQNKVKYVVPNATWIETIDSIKIAESINNQSNRTIKSLIEVNLGDENSKSGVITNNLFDLIEKISKLSNIDLKGLMIIPPYNPNPEKSRPYFKKLKILLNQINEKKIYKSDLTELSMGMSHDFTVAIEEGATIIRVGTAIFGGRN